jgi:hypothetical protein
MLFKLGSCELSHVSPRRLIGDVGRAPNNVSPQRQCALSLDELHNSKQSLTRSDGDAKNHVRGRGSQGFFLEPLAGRGAWTLP